MAYTGVSVYRKSLAGQVVTESAGVAGGSGTGYKVPNEPGLTIRCRNTASNTPSITLVTGGSHSNGQALPDITVQMAASQSRIFGPFPKEDWDQRGGSDDGYIYVYFSGGNETELRVSAEA